MTTSNSRFLRRAFLSGVGGSGLAALVAPLLRAEAQSVGPQRLLIIHRPCGTRPEKWFPTAGGVKDWGMTELLKPFEALRNDMVVLKGIDIPRSDNWLGDKHGAGMVAIMCPSPSPTDGWKYIPGSPPEEVQDDNGKAFTGTAASVDQELLKNVTSLQGTSIASLQLGASLYSMKGAGPECLRVISYAGFNQALWPESRPETAFNNIFANLVLGGDQGAIDRVRAKNKSILDFVIGDLTAIRAKVPSSQLPKLDSHLTAIRALEAQVTSGPSPGCSKPILGALPASTTDNDDARHALAAVQQTELIHSTFKCDLSRVATLTYSYGNSDIIASAVGGNGGIGHHEASHDDGAGAAQAAFELFYNQTTAKLLLDMKNTPEGSGSMLDNTLVVYFNECCIGSAHSIEDNPILLFGGRTLGLNTGSYLQYTGRTHADLWVETFKRFGYNKPVHGDPFWNKGPLGGLYG